ncbi:hypothetical protein [Nostoc sp.]|uniref:hypothetical protein n=1 Tax=Nostoc sp. TaxID=1180 RepID=UPI002FF5ADA4
MFTRTELEVKSSRALCNLCLIQYGIQAIGNPADKASYINALLTFPVVACKQVLENKGFKSPMLSQVQALEATLEAMGTPTPEQPALLKVTMEGSTTAPKKLTITYFCSLSLTSYELTHAVHRF